VAERWIRPACIALLVLAWVLDLLTPQLFIAAILLNGPIAMSSLALDWRFTRLLVVLALVADITAGYMNGVHDNRHWEAVAVADRTIAAFSFLLVGGLSIATQRSAARAGELAARQDRAARERSVRKAIEAVRVSINPELVKRAIVREARRSLGVDEALLYVFEPSIDEPTTYSAADSPDVEVSSVRPPAEIMSLLSRFADHIDGIGPLLETDALGRLRLSTFGAQSAIAAPLVEHETTFGVLVLLRRTAAFEPHYEEGLAAFADQCAIALAQANVFAQLGERNEELATANVALRERGDVIRDIVYALSHDLRTPLAAARMTMQQALDGAYGQLPADYREILERTMASNDELQRLAETLLLVSRYESGDRSTQRDPVDAAALATDVVRELEPLWQGKHLEVTVDASEPAMVMADEREIRRAIVNLLANAITWTPAERRILVGVRAGAGVAQVVIDDDGYGVPEAEREQLFERVGRSSRQGAGSGLGLYLVRRIAESHGGSVTYAPRPDGGSIFTLSLPSSAAGPTPQPASNAQAKRALT
jgi:signal transduction histidine kinase